MEQVKEEHYKGSNAYEQDDNEIFKRKVVSWVQGNMKVSLKYLKMQARPPEISKELRSSDKGQKGWNSFGELHRYKGW